MLLPILHYPDARLHTVAQPIDNIDETIQQLAANMAETMYQPPGVGLAATQVNVHRRMVVIDVSESKDHLLCLINPVIVERDGEKTGEEGCLSVPGIYELVSRSETVTVQYQDLNGIEQRLAAEGLLAVCVQHEIDHLNGIVFVQHLSRLKQNRIQDKLSKRQRETL